MRTTLGLLFLLAVPAAAAAQGAEGVSCPQPGMIPPVDRLIQIGRGRPIEREGWAITVGPSGGAERFEYASFTRQNGDMAGPDMIVCFYRTRQGDVQYVSSRWIPRGTCEPTGWDVDQNNWAGIIWKTSDVAKAKLTCTQG